MNKHLQLPREPISAYTHFVGLILSVIGTIFIVIEGFLALQGSSVKLISSVIFGMSLIGLYSASTIYHWSHSSDKTIKILRKLDHSMIYVLIAGTYTPLLMTYLPYPRGLIFTSIIWAAAIVGITIKLCWFNAPRWLSTALYILMGWSIVFDMTAIKSMSMSGIVLLVLGGISYTIGGVIYAIKKPNISKTFGFHELFHVFVLLGSLFHYLIVVLYVL
ncbi:MAG: hemolysin III family protein [Oscillospiraceae bacterium]